jgi:hypothetical protein
LTGGGLAYVHLLGATCLERQQALKRALNSNLMEIDMNKILVAMLLIALATPAVAGDGR